MHDWIANRIMQNVFNPLWNHSQEECVHFQYEHNWTAVWHTVLLLTSEIIHKGLEKQKRKYSDTFAQDWTKHWAKCVFSCHNKAADVCLLMCVSFYLFTSGTSINRPDYSLLTSVFFHHFWGKIKQSRQINKHELQTYYLFLKKKEEMMAKLILMDLRRKESIS